MPWLAVPVGGALGASSRWGISVLVAEAGGDLPLATLAVNVLGCLAMGLLVAFVLAHPARHPLWRPFLGVGFLGGFTTFSAFAADTILLARDGAWAMSAAYLVVSLAGCLLAVWAGIAIGRRIQDRRAER